MTLTLSLLKQFVLRQFSPLPLEIDPEGRTHPYLAFHLDSASGILNHLFDHVQANARAFYVVMKTFEHGKKLA